MKSNSRPGRSNGNWKHGMSETREFAAWDAARSRCYCSSDSSFKNYGKRGIRVCRRWRRAFTSFLADMGPCPPGHQLERKDNSRGYSPTNCVWATRSVNCRNRRSTVKVRIGGKLRLLIDVCEERGIKYNTAYMRIRRGYSAERALSTPVGEIRNP